MSTFLLSYFPTFLLRHSLTSQTLRSQVHFIPEFGGIQKKRIRAAV